MILQNNKLHLFLFLLVIILMGCSDSSIQMELPPPEELASTNETLDIRNCDKNEDMVTTLADEAPVRQKISTSAKATLVESGSAIDIPDDVRDQLKSRLQSEYQPVFEGAVANAKKVEFRIPGHKIHMYKIQWTQRIYRSTITFSINDQVCTTSYVYTLEFPDLDSYTVMACTA